MTEGIYSQGKKKLEEEHKAAQTAKENEKLGLTIDQKLAELEEIKNDLKGAKVGDFQLIERTFTTRIVTVLKGMGEAYTTALATITQKMRDRTDKQDAKIAALQKTMDDAAVEYQRLTEMLRELLDILGQNAQKESLVLDKLNQVI